MEDPFKCSLRKAQASSEKNFFPVAPKRFPPTKHLLQEEDFGKFLVFGAFKNQKEVKMSNEPVEIPGEDDPDDEETEDDEE